MGIYDFRNKLDLTDTVSGAIESLEHNELEKVQAFISDVKQQRVVNEVEKKKQLFNSSILPALVRYAEKESLLLEVNEDRENVISAVFRTNVGFSVNLMEFYSFVFLLSTRIGVELSGEEICMTCIYDLN